MKSLRAKYRKSLSKKLVIRLKTRHPDQDKYDGIIVFEGRDFICLAVEENFEFDGFIILAKKFVNGVRDSKFEECTNRIVRLNKAINKIKIPIWITKHKTLIEVLRYFQKKGIWPAIEIIYRKEGILYVGPITNVLGNEFSIYCYDADGSWEKNYRLSVNELFKIQFNDQYTTHFNNYMRKINRAKKESA